MKLTEKRRKASNCMHNNIQLFIISLIVDIALTSRTVEISTIDDQGQRIPVT